MFLMHWKRRVYLAIFLILVFPWSKTHRSETELVFLCEIFMDIALTARTKKIKAAAAVGLGLCTILRPAASAALLAWLKQRNETFFPLFCTDGERRGEMKGSSRRHLV